MEKFQFCPLLIYLCSYMSCFKEEVWRFMWHQKKTWAPVIDKEHRSIRLIRACLGCGGCMCWWNMHQLRVLVPYSFIRGCFKESPLFLFCCWRLCRAPSGWRSLDWLQVCLFAEVKPKKWKAVSRSRTQRPPCSIYRMTWLWTLHQQNCLPAHGRRERVLWVFQGWAVVLHRARWMETLNSSRCLRGC